MISLRLELTLLQVEVETEKLRASLDVRANTGVSIPQDLRFSKRQKELDPEAEMAQGQLNDILIGHAIKQRYANL